MIHYTFLEQLEDIFSRDTKVSYLIRTETGREPEEIARKLADESELKALETIDELSGSFGPHTGLIKAIYYHRNENNNLIDGFESKFHTRRSILDILNPSLGDEQRELLKTDFLHQFSNDFNFLNLLKEIFLSLGYLYLFGCFHGRFSLDNVLMNDEYRSLLCNFRRGNPSDENENLANDSIALSNMLTELSRILFPDRREVDPQRRIFNDPETFITVILEIIRRLKTLNAGNEIEEEFEKVRQIAMRFYLDPNLEFERNVPDLF